MSSSACRALYKRYLDVVKRWPLDPNKDSRDVAVQIRTHLAKRFPRADLTSFDHSEEQTVRKEVEALERLVDNVNKNLHSFQYSTSSGLSIEQLRRATATETLKKINEWYDAGIIYRMKSRFYSMFN